MNRPNLLVLMADQLRGSATANDSPCRIPNIQGLAKRGARFNRAYTPNPICSPARASLMTGLLPHNHGVLWVTHNVDHDQGNLRRDKPHWAQALNAKGYRTGYFGKWHVENTETPEDFGWDVAEISRKTKVPAPDDPKDPPEALPYIGRPSPEQCSLYQEIEAPDGYRSNLLYAVTDAPPEERFLGYYTNRALQFLDTAAGESGPWCCFLSLNEPHDPFICSHSAYERYPIESIQLPPNASDDLHDKPSLYAKARRAFADLSERQRREATACYYGALSEIDAQWGRVLQLLEERNQLSNTIILVTSDHGELLGAHGLFCKNIGAFEECYSIPMILAGPGIREGVESEARVGLHEIAPTLLDLCGLEPMASDGATFKDLLAGKSDGADRQEGYAEYHGGRYLLTQRVLWQDDWKFVFNGFDEDELYNLSEDPHELNNLAHDPSHAARAKAMMRRIWEKLEETGDRSLLNTRYAPLRLGRIGPDR